MILYILYIASYNGHIEVVKKLLNHNADIESKNISGNTALLIGIF